MIGLKLKNKLDEIGEEAMKDAQRYNCTDCNKNWNDISYKDGQTIICPFCGKNTEFKPIGKSTDKFRIYPVGQKLGT